MDLKELLEYLDIDSPEDLEYFENMADMMESDEDFPVETLKELFSDADMETVSAIIKEYFDDVLEHVPDKETELYSLLNTVRLSLAGMAKNIDEDNEDEMFSFAEEFERVHQWYCHDSVVQCAKIEEGGIDGGVADEMCLRDALAVFRMEKLGEEEYEYDFEDCLDFEMDEYTMTFAELMEDETDPDEESIEDDYGDGDQDY